MFEIKIPVTHKAGPPRIARGGGALPPLLPPGYASKHLGGFAPPKLYLPLPPKKHKKNKKGIKESIDVIPQLTLLIYTHFFLNGTDVIHIYFDSGFQTGGAGF